MAIKKEGATTLCNNCGTDLICRTKDYGGNYASTLQWQNFDGTAHYATKDGKTYSCNVPDDEELEQTKIPTTTAPQPNPAPATTPGIAQPATMTRVEFQILAHVEQKIDTLLGDVERLKDMVLPMFQKMVDDQIGKSKK